MPLFILIHIQDCTNEDPLPSPVYDVSEPCWSNILLRTILKNSTFCIFKDQEWKWHCALEVLQMKASGFIRSES